MTREELKEHIDELLKHEEENEVLWFTRKERREFQQGVQALFDEKAETIDRVLEIIDDEIASWERIRDELGCRPKDDNAEAALALARSRISELMKEGEQE